MVWNGSTENVVMEAGLIPFVMPQNTPSQMQPMSLAVTEFHYLLLYPHALVSQSRISGAVLIHHTQHHCTVQTMLCAM
jgi:hypothetical protein